jgi:hypothetical protein
MEVRPAPGSLSYPELKLLETTLQRRSLATSPSTGRILIGKLLQVIANEPGERRVALNSDSPHLFYEIVI